MAAVCLFRLLVQESIQRERDLENGTWDISQMGLIDEFHIWDTDASRPWLTVNLVEVDLLDVCSKPDGNDR